MLRSEKKLIKFVAPLWIDEWTFILSHGAWSNNKKRRFFTAQIIWITKHYVNINHRKIFKSIHISLLQKVDVCSSFICMEFDCYPYHNHSSSNSNDWFASAVKRKFLLLTALYQNQRKGKSQKNSTACAENICSISFHNSDTLQLFIRNFCCGIKKCFSCRKLQKHIGSTLNKYSTQTISPT